MANGVAEAVKPVSIKGKIDEAWGIKFKTPLEWKSEYTPYASLDDVPEGKRFTDKELLKIYNDTLKTNAAAEARTNKLAEFGFDKPDPKDPEISWKKLFKTLVDSGHNEKRAARMTAATFEGVTLEQAQERAAKYREARLNKDEEGMKQNVLVGDEDAE